MPNCNWLAWDSMRARFAVIPAAGLGTRFYPWTKAVPKELLPIVDVPALQLVMDEAIAAGYEEFISPHMVNEASGYGTGQLPDKEGQIYQNSMSASRRRRCGCL